MDMAAEKNQAKDNLRATVKLKFYQKRKFQSNLTLLLISIPALAQVVVFKYLTLPFLVIAFKDFKPAVGILKSEWVGFNNFRFLFGITGKGWEITRNTMLYNAVFIFVGTLVSLALALLIAEIFQSFWSRFYQSVLFLPNFLSWVVVGYAGYALLSTSSGAINGFFGSLGIESVSWYKKVEAWPWILLLANTWKNVGVATLIYLASILAINSEYYEVSELDGASRWNQIWHITLPLISPMIIVMVLLSIGRILNADFGLFYEVPRLYLNPQLIGVTEVIDTYVYRALINLGQVEMATAANLFQSVIGFILIVVSNWIVRRIDPERALF
jgi:putative aldouronate transport system permease protein